MSAEGIILEGAERIGRRIVKQALWQGRTCTWPIMVLDPVDPLGAPPTPGVAVGDLYEGTAGIALFLLELFRTTGSQEAARTAEGAIRYALDGIDDLDPDSFGFFSGRVGLAYAAIRFFSKCQ